MNSVAVFDEPQLEFASGGRLTHPRDGLTLFGPAECATSPEKIRYGIIGTQNGVAEFREFVEAIGRPILTHDYLSDVLWPHFPGFAEAFHASFSPEPAWAEELDTLTLKNAATQRDAHQRVFGVTSLFLERMRTAKMPGKPFHFFVVVVPDFVFTNCRPVSRFQGGHGFRVSRRERRLRVQMLDFFENYEPEQYLWSLDFRSQIKARAMELGVPIQIIRESTLYMARVERRVAGRQLTPLSDRAWNLSAALYYKAGGKPWKWPDARAGVCHVGLSFKDTETPGVAGSFAQMFLDDGDGVVVAGDEGRWGSQRKGEYHLSKESAGRLLSRILDTSKATQRFTEIFLHSRLAFNEEELEGYRSACPKGAKLVAIRVAPERAGMRLFRAGAQPVLRGTFLPVSEKRGFLWAAGFKPRLRVYDGSGIPQPLSIHVQHGDADAERVARDIFALTKLNYNNSQFGENQPITTHFSQTVGEILAGNRSVASHNSSFAFYI